MRVGSMTIFEQMRHGTATIAAQMAEANTRLFTGKRINSPSDDPEGEARALGYKVSLQTNAQYESNIQRVRLFIDTTDRALTSAANALNNLKAVADPAMNPQTGDLAAGQSELAVQVRDFLLSVANTQFQGRYVFSGFRTNQQAFAFSPGTNSFAYNGDLGSIQAPVDQETNIGMNVQGSTAFSVKLMWALPPATLSDGTPVSYTQTQDPATGVNTIRVRIGTPGDPAFDTFTIRNVMDLANIVSFAWKGEDVDGAGLDASATITQQKARHRMESLSTVIDAARDQILQQQADLGIRGNALIAQQSTLDRENLSLENGRSKIEDADVNQTYADIQQANTALQALRGASASIWSRSLFDFLK